MKVGGIYCAHGSLHKFSLDWENQNVSFLISYGLYLSNLQTTELTTSTSAGGLTHSTSQQTEDM